MRNILTFIDGDCVGDTITRIQHNTSGSARGIQRKDSLDGDVHGRCVEGLEHNLEKASKRSDSEQHLFTNT